MFHENLNNSLFLPSMPVNAMDKLTAVALFVTGGGYNNNSFSEQRRPMGIEPGDSSSLSFNQLTEVDEFLVGTKDGDRFAVPKENIKQILGGPGNDYITGGDGADTIFGGKDDDFLIGNIGNDILNGNLGNDRIKGGSGNDVLTGGKNDDTLAGGSGNNQLFGDGGDDQLFGGEDNGNDTLTGGDGANIFVIGTAGGFTVINDYKPSDRIRISVPGNSFPELSENFKKVTVKFDTMTNITTFFYLNRAIATAGGNIPLSQIDFYTPGT